MVENEVPDDRRGGMLALGRDKASASPRPDGVAAGTIATWHRRLDLPPGEALPAGLPAARAPEAWLRRVRPGDPADPLLRQVLPDPAEAVPAPGETDDPLGEAGAVVAPGVLQRFAGRALVLTTDRCALTCRFCFRRGRRGPVADRATALRALAALPDLREVILSGGDPLVPPATELAAWLEALEDLPGLRRLRVHTRLPVADPAALDAPRLTALAACRLPLAVVLHVNHPAELDAAVAAACDHLRSAGAMLLAQGVLLAGVNDEAGVLAELCEREGDLGIVPYYLHLLDPAVGTARFRVPDARAASLHRGLTRRLPGHLVPRLVRDQPGADGKHPPELTGRSA